MFSASGVDGCCGRAYGILGAFAGELFWVVNGSDGGPWEFQSVGCFDGVPGILSVVAHLMVFVPGVALLVVEYRCLHVGVFMMHDLVAAIISALGVHGTLA